MRVSLRQSTQLMEESDLFMLFTALVPESELVVCIFNIMLLKNCVSLCA